MSTVEEGELGSGGKGVHVAASEVVFAATTTMMNGQQADCGLYDWVAQEYLYSRSL